MNLIKVNVTDVYGHDFSVGGPYPAPDGGISVTQRHFALRMEMRSQDAYTVRVKSETWSAIGRLSVPPAFVVGFVAAETKRLFGQAKWIGAEMPPSAAWVRSTRFG